MKIKHRIIWGITLFSILAGMIPSCNFFSSFNETPENTVSINSLSLGKTTLETQVGSMEYISVSVKPMDKQKEVKLQWSYDRSIIECDTSSSWGVTIRGIAEGQTTLRCSYNGYDAACLVTVKGIADDYETVTEPYIYSNYTILQTTPGVSEKVFVSLYGGDASDIDGYNWTIDNPSVASIQSTGQYCIITAKEAGYARIKITHNKAAYPYYMGIYVFEDASKVGYITTSNNIVSMNIDDDEKEVSVSLVNGNDSFSDRDFTWEIISEDDSSIPVELSWNGNNAVITPKANGSCTIRVTHPDAVYPLDILCRVITVVKNVYIKPDKTVVTLTGDAEQTVNFTLENIKSSEYNAGDFKYSLDDYNVAKITASAGNMVVLQGVSNGSCKLIVTHEKSAYSREVLIISNGQIKDAVDASCYITTSQNYIRTKEGAEGQEINVSLKGGEDGDESGFSWSVESTAADGSTENVISLETADGSVFHTSSRMVSASYVYASAFMEPLKEGTAVITVTHPKIAYPTQILVKVLSKDAILEEQLYFSGEGLVKILNGESKEYKVSLMGESKKTGDERNISWECDTDYLKLNADGDKVHITAPVMGTGSTVSNITVNHPKAESDKRVLVMTADDLDTLNSMKALYSDKTYFNIEEGSSVSVYLYAAGYDESCDFSRLTWKTKNPEIIEAEKSPSNPFICKVKGLKSGTAVLTASLDGNECAFTITVYPKGSVSIEPEIYFTTSQNVITLGERGKSALASVTAVNLKSSEYMNITWSSSRPDVASVTGNGTTATVIANGEGETVLSVSHKDSQNTLKIYVRVGSEYIMEETESVVYIKADNLITVITGGEDRILTAGLVNYTGLDFSGFHFESLDPSVAEISGQSENGTASIRGINPGFTEIVISHKATKVTKNVLVVAGRTETEIREIIRGTETVPGKVYFTARNNTVTFSSSGKSKSVNISVLNMNPEDYSSIRWKSSDSSVAEVYGNGNTATITSRSKGYTTIEVSSDASMNSVIFHVFVDTEDITESVVSIKTESLITAVIGGNETRLSASLVNFSGTDDSGFSFSSSNPNVAIISSQSANGTALVRGVASGTAEITVSHSATSVTKSVLVVVGKTEEEIKEIISGGTVKGAVYFLVSGNTVSFDREGITKTVSFTAANLEKSEYSKIIWKTSDSRVAEVYGNGNTATIKATGSGKAVIEASYDGSLNSALFYVFVGEEYVTETAVSIKADDFVTLITGDEDKKISASLVNSASADVSGFSFFVMDESLVSITAASENGTAYLRGLKSGYTEIVVSHRSTSVTKKILVVVGKSEKEISEIIEGTEMKKKTYLTIPSNTVAFSETGPSKVVTVQAVNLSSDRHSEISWKCSDSSVIDIYPNGNSATFRAKGKGTTVVEVSHPDSINSLNIYVFVETEDIIQTVVSIQAENFITAIEGGTETRLTATLKNFMGSDDSGFSFQSTNPEIAEISSQSANGTALIKGVKSGTTEILISHTATRVTKSVLIAVGKTEKEIKEILSGTQTKGSIYFLSSSSTVTFSSLNEMKDVMVNAVNLDAGEYSSISWTSLDPSVAEVYPYGKSATIKAVGTGKTVIEASYYGSLNKAIFYVFAGEEYVRETEVSISCEDLVTVILGNDDVRISASLLNYSKADTSGFSFRSENPDVIEIAAQSSNGTAYIHGLKKGYGEITVKHTASQTEKRVLVVVGNDQDEISKVIDGASAKGSIYFSAKENAVFFPSKGKSRQITVEAVNLEKSAYPEITWTSSNQSVADVYGYGNTATLSAKGDGTAVIEVSHKDSINKLKIYVFVNTDDAVELVPSIRAEDLVTVIAGGDDIKISASLVNSGLSDTSGFSFSSADETVARISAQSENGTAYIKGTGTGYTEITVSHIKTTSKKKILVVSGKNTAEITEIIGDTEVKNSVYFTAGENTVAFSETGMSKVISVQAVNLPSNLYSQIKWKCSDSSVVEMYQNGNLATLRAKKKGTAVIEVSHPDSINTMNFYVFVQTDDIITASVSIEAENLITAIAGGSETRLNATLKNFAGSDQSGFSFKSSDTSIAEVSGQSSNGTALVKGIKSGIAEIIISHTRIDVKRSVLVAVGETEAEVKNIIEGSKIQGSIYLSTKENAVIFPSGGKTKTVSISAVNMDPSLQSQITWTSSDTSVAEVYGSGTTASIRSKNNGNAVIEISHKDSINKLKLYVFVNTENVIDVAPYIITEDFVTLIQGGNDRKISATLGNYSLNDTSGFSFSSEDENIVKISAASENGTAYIQGTGAGYTEITVSHKSLSSSKKILAVVGKNEAELNNIAGEAGLKDKAYLTVSSNTVAFSKTGTSKDISVSAVNLSETEASKIRWTSSDPSVAEVYANGKSASIRSLKRGSAVVEVTHPDCINSLKIYVFVDTEDVVQAVVSIQADNLITAVTGTETRLAASLNNFSGEDDSGFSFRSTDSSVAEITGCSENGTAVIKGIKSGTAEIIISHKAVSMTKSVLVVVGKTEKEIKNIVNGSEIKGSVYLSMKDNVVSFPSKGKTRKVTIEAANLDKSSYSAITWTSSNKAVAEVMGNGTSATIKSTGDGTAVIEASHPDSINSLKIYVSVNTDDVVGLVPSIKTENLVTVIAGGDDIKISASLVNSGSDDAAGFSFKAANEKIAKVSAQSENGTAYIKGISTGYTEITVSHKNVSSSKKILVVVGKNTAEIAEIIGETEAKNSVYFTIPENTVAFTGTGQSKTVSVQTVNLPSSRCSEIMWKCSDPSVVDVYQNGNSATLKAKKKGTAVIEVSHSESINTINIYVFVATEDIITASVSIEAENLITVIAGGSETRLHASLKNFSGSDTSGFSFKSSDTKTVQISGQSTNGTALVKGIKSGIAEIIISHKTTSVTKSVLVAVGNTEEEIKDIISDTGMKGSVYLTVKNNTVSFPSSGSSQTVSVEAVNLDRSGYSQIEWTSSDSSVCEVYGNGNSATIMAKKDGNAVIEISHPDSINKLKLYVFVNTPELVQLIPSIKTEDLVTVIAGKDDMKISASLINSNLSDTSGFSFKSGDEKIAKISAQSSNGTAYVKGISAGYTEITVSHSKLSVTKKILVVVGKTEAEVNEIIGNTENKNKVYLTVSENTVAFSSKGKSKTVSINAVNLAESKASEIKWTSSDSKVAKVYPNGKSATIEAAGKGSATIEISHTDSINKLTLYVFVDTEDVLQVSTSIQAEDFVTLITGEDPKRLSASLVNYKGSDTSGFSFSSTDVNVVQITAKSENGTAYIKGLRSGSAEIVISHKATSATKHVLVIVGASQKEVESKMEGTSVKGQVYLTTKENTVSFGSTGKTKQISVDAVNLDDSRKSGIRWTSSDTKVAEVYSNGNTATVKSIGKGTAVIEATHSESLNKISFYVFVNTEDVIESVVTIEADDIVTVITGQDDVKLSAVLKNYSGNSASGFTFESLNTRVVQIAGQSSNGTAYLKGISSGYADIKITHTATKVTKLVLAVVGNSQSEISQIVQDTPVKGSVYLSAKNNTVSFTKTGQSKQISLGAVNLDAADYSKITWKSSSSKICEVYGNGKTATVRSLAKGSAVIEASVTGSLNKLSFYVFVGTEDVVPATGNIKYIACSDVVTLLKDGESQLLQAYLINGNEAENSGFSFEIDNKNIADISAQSVNGTAYIKPKASGQAKITVKHTATSITKQVLVIVGNSEAELAGISYLTTSTNVVSIGEGTSKSVSVSIKNTSETVLDGYTWSSSNPSVIGVTSTGATALLTGNGIGTAIITVKNKACTYDLKIIAQCVDPVAASSNPYIQLSSSVITVNVGPSFTSVTADLVGGTDEDKSSFVWSSSDSTVCSVYGQNETGKIRALKKGQAYITVRHPKAAYAAQVLVVCDEVKESECYISVPSSIISMKPNASSQTITANLVNGSATDKYNFTWSLDVYDIIDFQYSANVCTITPKQTGSVTITVSHPKAAFSQQIIVNVQEYTDFAFPQNSITVTQGTVSFLNMEVPVTKLASHVEYSVDNPSICSISGTKSVAQITGIKAGSTTVRAKLKSTSTGTIQAESELLVYVKAAQTTEVYITSSSTITTVQKGKSQTLSATLTGTGVTASDQNGLTWTTSDTDVIKITGVSSSGTVTGQQIYITAEKSGEALITCSHPKAASTLQFYVVVPGTGAKSVSLNKTYLTISKSSSGSTLKATIENAEGSTDYAKLEWSAEKVNGKEIVRIMGNGQTVTIYPVEVGQTTVSVQLPDVKTTAKCTVVVAADKSMNFETNSRKVQPFHSATIKYTVSPPDAQRTWNANQDDDYFTFKDLGCDSKGNGSVEITGVKEGSGNLICVTNGSAKANLSVKVSWDYEFSTDTSSISGTPAKEYKVNYTVNPGNAIVTVTTSSIADINLKASSSNTEAGSGVITVSPTAEGKDSFTITAKNKDTGEIIGTKTINLKFGYSSLTVTPKLISKDGSFSRLDAESGILYIGDGETVTLGFTVKEPIEWSVSETKLEKKISNSKNDKLTNGIANQVVIQHTEDKIEKEYLITTWYVPMQSKYETNSSGNAVLVNTNNQLDPKTDFSWKVNDVGFMDTSADWYLSPEYYWKKEIPSKANTRMSIADYRATPWYWRPAHGAIYNWSGSVAAGPWSAAATGNQPAKLVDSIDTSVVSSENTDILTVSISHNGVIQKIQIQVITETRNCKFNQK